MLIFIRKRKASPPSPLVCHNHPSKSICLSGYDRQAPPYQICSVCCCLCLCLTSVEYLDCKSLWQLGFLFLVPLSSRFYSEKASTHWKFIQGKCCFGATSWGKNHHLPNTWCTNDNNGKIWPHTRSNLASKKDSTYFCVNFIKFGSFVSPLICPDHLLSRSAVRGSVSSCCGCRPWGTTVLRSSSLSLPVWCQVSLLCPPPEGPVPLTPSFTTLSPTPLMVHMNTLWIY